MWDYSDSEADEMVSRCSYCGKFCSRAKINAASGLCLPCKAKLHPTRPKPEGDARQAKADKMAIDEEDDDAAASDSGESVGSKAEGKEEVPLELDSRSQGLGESSDSEEPNLCARCWTRPPTKVLYNSPTCEECYQVAKEMKEGSRGTKQRRFQPPTPLEPGKKLTRVCDSCRQKRKRCQHRRVVDADDPAVLTPTQAVPVEAPIQRTQSRRTRPPSSEATKPATVSKTSTKEAATEHCAPGESMQGRLRPTTRHTAIMNGWLYEQSKGQAERFISQTIGKTADAGAHLSSQVRGSTSADIPDCPGSLCELDAIFGDLASAAS
ncbi:hypothetical protein CISG_05387 [Coccidioides immitis RMSCC 3703]|uniref:Uncharacterized protein n=1 Tax=Coccidioides immitis RMSCC 3703 TaxID=454286 RepID=A0A0J8TQ87_COCIT|nr:hypothetical protein CISG_05387 [Coccidioides immitis RMSCC 3703]